MRSSSSIKSKEQRVPSANSRPNQTGALNRKASTYSTPSGQSTDRQKPAMPNNGNTVNPTSATSVNPLDNPIIQMSKTELENKLGTFINFITRNKPLTSSKAAPEELKSVFMSLFEGQMRSHRSANDEYIKIISDEDVLQHSKEVQLQMRIRELEGFKTLYENKVNNHAEYILDLEKKVTVLIEEYHKTLATNERLNTELNSIRNDTSILNSSDIHQYDKFDVYKAEVDELAQKNIQLNKNLTLAQKKIASSEQELSKTESLNSRNRELENQIQTLHNQLNNITKEVSQFHKEFQSLITETSTPPNSSGLHDGIQIEQSPTTNGQSVQQEQKQSPVDFRYVMNSLKIRLNEHKLTEERLEKEVMECQTLVRDINNKVEELSKERDLATERCTTLQEDLVNKSKLEELTESLLEKITMMETKMQGLVEENNNLQSFNENNLIYISNLKNELVERNHQMESLCLEDSKDKVVFDTREEYAGDSNDSATEYNKEIREIVPSDNKDFEEERAQYKQQIAEYSQRLEMLVGKIQLLVKINEGLSKESEFMRYDFINYKTAVGSAYYEIRKHLERIKIHDAEVQSYLGKVENAEAQDFNFITNSYYMFRREAIAMDYIIEERRAYV